MARAVNIDRPFGVAAALDLVLDGPGYVLDDRENTKDSVASVAAPDADAPAATLLHDGRRVALAAAGLTLGRRSDNDVVIHSDRASRHHARIASEAGRWYVSDLGSMNGTYLNGERVAGESRWLESGD